VRLLPSLSESDLMVILIPDTGMRYLSKVHNNEWMRENRYLEAPVAMNAGEIVKAKAARGPAPALVTVAPSDTVRAALDRMRQYDFSQLPVFEEGAPAGALYEDKILSLALEGKDLSKLVVREAMGAAFPVVPPTASIDQITAYITRDCPAVFVEMGGRYDILTKYDLIQSIARLAGPPH
jgi:cystathionine beta-synthase